MIKAREFLWELVEDVTGARLTISLRPGGRRQGGPAGRLRGARSRKAFARDARGARGGRTSSLTGNRIFMDRMVGRRRRSRARRRSRTRITGPLLRAARACRSTSGGRQPYWAYDRLEFEIPTRKRRRQLRPVPGPHGRDGAVDADRRAGARPAARRPGQRGLRGAPDRSRRSYVDRGKQGKTEGLLLMPITLSPNLQGQERRHHATRQRPRQARRAAAEGDDVRLDRGPDEPLHARSWTATASGRPPGEAYFPVEGANGELGFYVVSDGTDRPYRVRCRPPVPAPGGRAPRMIEGEMVADIIPTFGSVNMIGGELDR